MLAGEGFEAFRQVVETPSGGIVFTAHPTFALSRDLRAALAAYVTKPAPAHRAALKAEAGAKGAAHGGVWGRRAPGLAEEDPWRPPLEGLRERR